MIERFYSFLEMVGFAHPLHPMLTHVPMGMIIGAVLFSLLGVLFKKQSLTTTAQHCSTLALVFIVPVIIAGILDWQKFLDGEMEVLIIVKMVLGGILTALLAVAFLQHRAGATPKRLVLIYLLCLACAGGLGYSGGELVYG